MLTCVEVVEKAVVHNQTNNNRTAPVPPECAEAASEIVTVMSFALSFTPVPLFLCESCSEPGTKPVKNERKVSREPIWIFYPLKG